MSDLVQFIAEHGAHLFATFSASGAATLLVEKLLARSTAFAIANEQEHVRRRIELIERLSALLLAVRDQIDKRNDLPSQTRDEIQTERDLDATLQIAALYLSNKVLKLLRPVAQLAAHHNDPNFVPPKVEPDLRKIQSLLVEAAKGEHRA